MSEVLETIAKRSSTRAYKAEALTDAQIQLLLKAGLEAPTARNQQEIHISVVDKGQSILKEIDAEKRRLLAFGSDANAANFYYDAPNVFFLSADKDCSWGRLDAGICVENIAIAAEALGLGSVIIGIINGAMQGERKEYFAKSLQFPDNYEFAIAIAVGYKAVEKTPHEIDIKKNVTFIR